MALTGDTGNGATLTLALYNGTTSITTALSVISITPGEITTESVDVTTLGTTDYMENIPSDLRSVAPFSATYKFITTTAFALPAIAGSMVGTCTLTWPTRTGETAAATFAGTGYVTSNKLPDMANGELQVGEISWQYDGDTGPTYTVSS